MPNKLLGKGAVVAPNIEPSKILRNVEPVEKHCTNQTTPAAHQPLIRFSISEKLVSVAHADRLASLAKETLLYARKTVT